MSNEATINSLNKMRADSTNPVIADIYRIAVEAITLIDEIGPHIAAVLLVYKRRVETTTAVQHQMNTQIKRGYTPVQLDPVRRELARCQNKEKAAMDTLHNSIID